MIEDKRAVIVRLSYCIYRMNAGFLREAALDEIVHLICVRTCHRVDHLTHECMVLLDTILKFGYIFFEYPSFI